MTNKSKSQESAQKRRPGRPKLADDEVQGHFLTMRLTAEHAEAIKKHGGSPWARNVLIEALQKGESVLQSGVRPDSVRLLASKPEDQALPKLDLRAACGFPSPAGETAAEETDLFDLLVPNPAKTILVEASGDSMVDAGIFEGDLLIVELSREARSGQIVLVCYDGNFLVKRFKVIDGKPELRSENELANYPVLKPREGEQFEIQGIVRHVIRSFR